MLGMLGRGSFCTLCRRMRAICRWERQERGFDNRDFFFTERGVITGGRCVAIAPLPDYAVGRVRTGQFVAGEGQLWAVEFSGGR